MDIEHIRGGPIVRAGSKDAVKPTFEKSICDPVDNETKQAKSSLMKCCGCDEPYDECDKCPKSLRCGHSLCNECVNKDTLLVRRCPECLILYRAADVKHFPINYPLLRIIGANPKEENFLKDIKGTMVIPSSISPSDLKEESWRCPAHGSPTAFLCVSCNMWACPDCLVVDHPGLPRGSCRILSLVKAIEKIKKKHRKETNATVEKINLVKNNMEPEADHINFLVKHCPSSERSHSRIQHTIDNMMDELQEKDKSVVNASISLLKKTQKGVKKTISPKKITALCKNLADCKQNLGEYIGQKNDRKKLLKQEISMHLKMDLKLLIEGGGRVYAVRRENRSRIRWAQISAVNNRLTVSSLREGQPPDGGLNVQYEVMREMVHRNNPTVFFDIGTTDISHGLVFIRLYQDCRRVRSFVLLCSGEDEACYKGTSFFKMDCYKKTICGGDLENKDGTGGNDDYYCDDDNCLVEKHKDAHRYCLIYFWGLFSIFGFHHVSGLTQPVMGKVTKGSDVIQTLCESETVSGIVVRECGFLIPRDHEEDYKASEE